MKQKAVAIDIESTSLEVAKVQDETHKILSVAFVSSDGTKQCFDAQKDWGTIVKVAKRYINDPSYILLFHHGAFDVAALRLAGIPIPFNMRGDIRWHDTMCLSYCLFPSPLEYHSLAVIGDQIGLPKLPKPDFSTATFEDLDRYNIRDGEITLKAFGVLMDELLDDEEAYLHYMEIELPYIEVIMMLQSGIFIDGQKLEEVKDLIHDETETKLKDLVRQAGFFKTKEVRYKTQVIFSQSSVPGTNAKKLTTVGRYKAGSSIVFDHDDIEPFNPNSSRHIVETLGKLGWKPKKYTDKGSVKTDEKTLLPLASKYPLIKDLFEFKRLNTLHNTFLKPIFEKKDDTNRLCADFLQFNVVTHRLSSRNPNLQNIPARDERGGSTIRRMFVPSKGCKFVVGDLDRIEVFVLAFYLELLYGDRTFSDVLRRKEDIHQYNADLWGVERKLAKNGLFAFIYGARARKLAETLGISEKEAQKIIDAMEEHVPYLFEFRDDVVDWCEDNRGVLHDWLGGKLYVPGIMSDNKKEYSRATRQIVNYVIQGTAGSVFKELQLRALHVLREYAGAMFVYDRWHDNIFYPPYRQVLAVHDEACYEVPEEDAEEIAERLTDVYTTSDILCTEDFSLEVSATFKVGDNWYDAKGE